MIPGHALNRSQAKRPELRHERVDADVQKDEHIEVAGPNIARDLLHGQRIVPEVVGNCAHLLSNIVRLAAEMPGVNGKGARVMIPQPAEKVMPRSDVAKAR